MRAVGKVAPLGRPVVPLVGRAGVSLVMDEWGRTREGRSYLV